MSESTVTIIKGVEGFAVLINDYRVAGPKAWGGGKIIREWTIKTDLIKKALKLNDTPPPPGERSAGK